jgi:hypothetical protein
MAARSTLPNQPVPDTVRQDERNSSPVQAAPAPQQPVQRQPVKRAEPAPGRSPTARFRNPIGGRIPATRRYSRFVIACPVMPGPRPGSPEGQSARHTGRGHQGRLQVVIQQCIGCSGRAVRQQEGQEDGKRADRIDLCARLALGCAGCSQAAKDGSRQQQRAQAVATAPQAAPVQTLQQQPQPANAPARAPGRPQIQPHHSPWGRNLMWQSPRKTCSSATGAAPIRLARQPGRSVDEVVDQVLARMQ